MKKQMTQFTFRLTEAERKCLDIIAETTGVSAGRFLTAFIIAEAHKYRKEIADRAVLNTVAKKYGFPDSIADNLKSPKDLSEIMARENYLKFSNEVKEQIELFDIDTYLSTV